MFLKHRNNIFFMSNNDDELLQKLKQIDVLLQELIQFQTSIIENQNTNKKECYNFPPPTQDQINRYLTKDIEKDENRMEFYNIPSPTNDEILKYNNDDDEEDEDSKNYYER